jgi:glycosyltransferase involved in cell wall biosynthesis
MCPALRSAAACPRVQRLQQSTEKLMPLISVLIAVYNGEAFIARAVDSALAQDFPNFEVIVVDDGSTDSTGLILRGYGDKIRSLRQDNHGQPAALNRGAAIARGEYVAFLDADDWWREDKLALTHLALESHGTAVLAFSACRQLLLDEIELSDWRCEKAPSFDDMFTRRIDIPPSAVLMRRSVFERCGGFSEKLQGRAGEFADGYLWLLALEHGEFIYIDELLVSRRARPSYCQESWFLSAKIFERLVLARYGRRALPIIQQNSEDLASMALNEAATQLQLGNQKAALRWWIQAARLRPWKAIWRVATTIPRASTRLHRR